jgi:isoquinoline 1-oxidoreductase subunit alpha
VITIDVNGASRQINIEPDTPLLWVLRDVIGLTGTKFGCGIAQCGACTVHVNGTAMRSCSVPIGSLDGAKIVTIEGLSPDNNHPVQRAWIEEGVPQCGYCQSGQIMAVVTFLKKYSKPTDADIDANITNICRCGTYEPLRQRTRYATVPRRNLVLPSTRAIARAVMVSTPRASPHICRLSPATPSCLTRIRLRSSMWC